MCNFEEGFILCTCAPVARGKRARKARKAGEPLAYLWRLERQKMPSDDWMDNIIGRFSFPSDDIGEGLTAEWVALNLNDRHCFDFEYQPQAGDCLTIFSEHQFVPYLSFCFEASKWEIAQNPPIFSLELQYEGKVSPVTPNIA